MSRAECPLFVELPHWDSGLFHSPSAIFRGAPFWSLNGELSSERLLRQLAIFQKMGFGGGHLHSRTGLATPYLSDAFMQCILDVADEAEKRGMLTWLYDEDRWPSGAAGGRVTQNKAFRVRHLRMTRRPLSENEPREYPMARGSTPIITERRFAAGWALVFEGESLVRWRRIDESSSLESEESGLYAYIEIPPGESWFNHQAYANLLDSKAIARFIEVTHDRYADVLGDRLGRCVPSIFTDEPQIRGMFGPASAEDVKDQFIAWADDFPETYRKQFDEDIFDHFPAILFDAADGSSPLARWRFRDHHTQRFVDAFAAQLGEWCGKHQIALTGHMMCESSLGAQSLFGGEVMRSLAHFQLPGIDMLCDHVEYTTAKQAQSLARQYDRPGVASELYGVTNWDFPFSGHLRQGNWQAALGVTVRVPHLSWYSMAGEAKRDYPASIGWHMPWWREYPAVEDHFARVSVAMQTGRPICHVAMLHPIESHWLLEGGAIEAHAEEKKALEEGFANTLTWLLEGQVDTDLLAESLLETLATADSPRRFGDMTYDAIVLPPMLTIRSSTLDVLERFIQAGGTVLLLGPPPEYVDAVLSQQAVEAAALWRNISEKSESLLEAVTPWREIEVIQDSENMVRAEGVVYQLREEADGKRILFICRVDKTADLENAMLRIKGHWRVEQMNTSAGEGCYPGERWTEDGRTEITVDLPVAGSLLLRLHPAEKPLLPKPKPQYRELSRLSDPDSISLDEPNVLLLDRAAWRIDQGDWRSAEEVLRIDNLVREALDMPHRQGHVAQPWVEPPKASGRDVTLRFEVQVDHIACNLRLALEQAAEASISLDGRALPVVVDGYYVDEDIATVSFPDLTIGTHIIEVTWPFVPRTGLEACYLLGDFGVQIEGSNTQLIELPHKLAFGDWTRQGLPFYGGNVTYHFSLARPEGTMALRVPNFQAALLAADIDGQRAGRILHSPWRVVLPAGEPGLMKLDITAFGDRVNTFGPVHNALDYISWCGPGAWRSEAAEWTDGYHLKPKGIFQPPILETVL